MSDPEARPAREGESAEPPGESEGTGEGRIVEPIDDDPPGEGEVRRLAVRGTLWTLLGYGGTQVLRLGSNLLLAYLLFPEAFGVMALVNAFLMGIEMFSDLGIWRSCVQNPRGAEPRFLGTAYTIQAARGVGLWLTTWALAWPYATFYDEPMLAPYLVVVGATSVLRGFESTAVFTLHREVAMRPLTLLELGSRGVQAVVTVGWAAVDRDVWSLVAGGVAYAVARLLGSHLLLGRRTARFAWDRSARRELVHFGKWLVLSSILTFAMANADRLILGKVVSKEELGLYSIALGYTSIAVAIAFQLADSVLFPILSRAQGDRIRVVELYLGSRRVVLWAAAGLCAAIVMGAPPFFELLYDSRYLEAGTIAQWLTLPTWTTVLFIGSDLVPLAFGRSRVQFLGNLVRAAGVPLALWGFSLAGLPGLIVGMATSSVLAHLFLVARFPGGQARVLGQSLRFSIGLVAYVVGSLGALELVSEAPRWASISVAGVLAAVPLGVMARVVLRAVRGRGAPEPEPPPAEAAGPEDQ